MRSIATHLTLALLVLGITPMPAAARGKSACLRSASLARKSCKLEGKADRRLEDAKCLQTADPDAAKQCLSDAREAFGEASEDCADQFDARRDLCEELGEDVYAPVLDPADFVAAIDNPYAPFAVGSRWVYETQTPEGLERNEVEVTGETKTILGIQATVVHDVVFLDDVLVEDTLDWVAQDLDGNVWYLGELAQNFEDGELVDIEGSFEAGRNGAQPGLWMKADPQVGDVYRQEFALGEAEDFGRVLSLGAAAMVPAGSYVDCLQTEDGSPLEPDTLEVKTFAPGVGMVLEENPETGERTELVEVTMP
jgi:hypothetical protein